MNRKKYLLFILARFLIGFVYSILPKFILSLPKTFMDLVRCARWSVKLRKYGNDSFIYPNVVINGAENVILGERVTIGEFCYIWGNAGLTIGDDTLIAAGCQITTLSHDVCADVYRESSISSPVFIDKNVWLGFGVKVMPGVSIGANSIIGAGSVVTKDIPQNVIAFGAPAKIIRSIKQQNSKVRASSTAI